MKPEPILSIPQDFDGKTIELTGYFICEREHCALYSSLDSLNPTDGIWLGNSGFSHKKLKALNRSMVQVVGVFHNRRKAGCGHFGHWLAELTQLTKIEQFEPEES